MVTPSTITRTLVVPPYRAHLVRPMITISFTQCCLDFKQDDRSILAAGMPIIKRVRLYEEMLQAAPTATFSTLDEHMLLVAQWLRRQGKIKNLQFVSVCDCPRVQKRTGKLPEPRRRGIVIQTDASGDMLSEPQHGYFQQRLYYLR